MKKILISACLIGDSTKYDGHSNYDPRIKQLLEKYELVPFCPEVEGGLPIPRNPSERKGNRVIMKDGNDVTEYFNKGAQLALNICKYLGIEIAILKDKSPSCGSNQIYNGDFNSTLIKGKGVTAELLEKEGIKILSENDIDSLL